MAKAKTETKTEHAREPIRAFETLRELFVAYDSNGIETAFLTAVEGARKDDIEAYCRSNLSRVARVENVPEVLYRRWQEPRWQRIRDDRLRQGFDEGRIAMMCVNEYTKKFVGVQQRYPVGPADPARRRAFQDEEDRNRRAQLDREWTPPTNSADDG